MNDELDKSEGAGEPEEDTQTHRPQADILPEQDELATAREVERMTPTNDELLRAAQLFPPPPEWFEGDEEPLF